MIAPLSHSDSGAPAAERLFELDLDGSIEAILAHCRELVEDTDFPTVARWRERGGKVLGHFQVYFPEEIAHAAGMLPVKVRGAQVDRDTADSHFGSYICSILRSSLELAMSDRLRPDMFVMHPICDAARNLTGIWARNLTVPAQILYLPQNPNSRFSEDYLVGEYRRVMNDIQDVAGRQIRDSDLQHSIRVFNENRRLLRELYAVRRDAPWLVSVDESYSLLALGGLIPREEHNDILRALLPRLRQRDAHRQDRMRVVFEGGFCEQPPLDLLRAIGQFVYVVDDDLLIGLRWILDDIPDFADPLRALAHAYIEQSSYSPVQHDLRKPKEAMLLRRIRASGAEAAIIAAAKMCEPGLDEQVAYAHALDREGVPYFITEFEEKMTGFDHLQVQLETFVENLLFA